MFTFCNYSQFFLCNIALQLSFRNNITPSLYAYCKTCTLKLTQYNKTHNQTNQEWFFVVTNKFLSRNRRIWTREWVELHFALYGRRVTSLVKQLICGGQFVNISYTSSSACFYPRARVNMEATSKLTCLYCHVIGPLCPSDSLFPI